MFFGFQAFTVSLNLTGFWTFEEQMPYQKYREPPIVVRCMYFLGWNENKNPQLKKNKYNTVLFPIIFLPCSCSGEGKQPSEVHPLLKSSVYLILWYFHQTFQLTSAEVSLKGFVMYLQIEFEDCRYTVSKTNRL